MLLKSSKKKDSFIDKRFGSLVGGMVKLLFEFLLTV